MNNNFEEAFNKSKFILMEGGLGERLKREYKLNGDENIALASHIYNSEGKAALGELFRQYFEIGKKYNTPLMVTTTTRRANKERISKSIYKDKNVIEDNVKFLMNLREEVDNEIYIGGLMGCKGDAYSKDGHLSTEEAFEFHLCQAEQFKKSKVDYLFAGIMPTLPEAIGMAKAMEATDLPYIISFMIRKDGCLLDGTTINDAIIKIDSSMEKKPIFYMTNCVHPRILNEGLSKDYNNTESVKKRFKGIQANTSMLSPEELDNSTELKTSNSISLAEDMIELYKKFNLKIFGGCCGTDNTHIDEIGKRIKEIL